MRIYLGLGSNLGERREHLGRALRLLEGSGVDVRRVSPVVESPAVLPEHSPADWNRPYLNLAAECEVDGSPEEMRALIEEIHAEMGRRDRAPWCPRSIDIDILLWGRERIATETLTIPHPWAHRRNFVLTPLIALRPRLTVPGLGRRTLLDWSRELVHHIPLWMGIVNVTPDSFSDGGRFLRWAQIEPHVDAMLAAGVHIIDVGGQSTRPGGSAIEAHEEWSRIRTVLERLMETVQRTPLRPLISVDTYYPDIAVRALELGVDMINDVSGLSSPEMIEVARESRADWVAMHQLTLPVDPARTLPDDAHPTEVVERWLTERLEAWHSAGLDLNRIIVDPGIGFGKNRLQSLELLRRAGDLRRYGVRTCVGHSRKSFMASFTAEDEQDKDLVTVGASMSLCAQGVDIIRVHNVPLHTAAYRGWSHLAPRNSS